MLIDGGVVDMLVKLMEVFLLPLGLLLMFDVVASTNGFE